MTGSVLGNATEQPKKQASDEVKYSAAEYPHVSDIDF